MTRPGRRIIRFLALGLLLGPVALPRTAVGQPPPYYSIDIGALPDGPHPKYDAERSLFQNQTDAFHVITFEGLPTGPFSNPNAPETPATATIALGQGVQALLSGVDPRPPAGSVNGITSSDPDRFLGYNVTPDGSQFLRVVPYLQSSPADVTFQFSQNVSAFGIAITGLGGTVPGVLELKFTPVGGTPQDLTIKGNIEGGLVFYGVSGFGETNQFTLQMTPTVAGTRDIIGLDDLTWSTAVVPEPSAFVLFTLGGALVWAARARQARQQKSRD